MIKFLFADTYYPQFLESFYSRHSPSNNIFRTLFGTADFYSKALTNLGYQAKTIVINDWQRQSRWAEKVLKNKYTLLGKLSWLAKPQLSQVRHGWEEDIFFRQVGYSRPQIIYFLDISYFSPEFLKLLKSRYGCLLVGQIASLLPDPSYLQAFDLIISSLPNLLSRIDRLGVQTHYQPLAFAPQVLDRLEHGQQIYKITHIGGYGPIHQERNRILNYAARYLPIDFWGYGLNNLPAESLIRHRFHSEAWGLDMYQILANSKVTLTKHIRRVAGPYANNMTLYEATGCGTLLLVDKKNNLKELFIPGKEVETYDTPAELVEKARFYLNHEEMRAKIAKAGQRKTLAHHTYQHRMVELLKFLRAKYSYVF